MNDRLIQMEKKHLLKSILIGMVIMSTVFGCQTKPSLSGLWEVTLVEVGDQEMTPNARWMRFFPDGTQESGNGGFQHSFGKWSLSPSYELSIEDQNGLKDNFGPFKVVLNPSTMTWTRLEEGDSVTVTLRRVTKVPRTYGDEVIGLWQLDDVVGMGDYFTLTDAKNSPATLFFRWDRKFVVRSSAGRIYGVYNVHGHKPEVELIPYSDSLDRSFWRMEIGSDKISMTKLNSDSLVQRTFKRIYEFP